jgi:hypothetical protein
LGDDEIDQIIDQYYQDHKVTFLRDTMIRALEDSRIIKLGYNGLYSFKYKYIYYYFVARYFADNLNVSSQQDIVREQIKELSAKLYVED